MRFLGMKDFLCHLLWISKGKFKWLLVRRWMPKNWSFQTVALEKTLVSPLDCKEVQPVHPKGNQSRIFTGRTDAEAEPPLLWPPDVKCWLITEDLVTGKDRGQEEKGATEDEMVGWHHRLYGHDFGHTPGDSEGQGSLVWCGPWSGKETGTATIRRGTGCGAKGGAVRKQ